ncbi:glutathione S-transferase family protein [Rhodospirillum centenum]|uniref:Glutathione S-transferase family protein, putative n=1 Tax=Rhodospirillum centenum (strain ATCC 51521 / SW) TaxID=414684 RepID=B6IMY7_RHOCS|nr:glutathione S-transferase C-terminal domain-containing protein [Rhodospirillum centenum]ACI98884.1 glutathione S-transferase family protein, putative [Rhodospirillum centenum SW]
MITLYSFGTPHGHRASIMLEETGLPYRVHPLDFDGDRVTDPALLRVSPLGRVPAITDAIGGREVRVFGSGAILLHLAEMTGTLLPPDPAGRAEALSWLFLGMTDLTPAMVGHFRFAVLAAEKLPYAIGVYREEIARCCDVLEARLARVPYLAGDGYTVADIAVFPFIDAALPAGELLAGRPALARWHAAVAARPAVQRGMAVPAPRAETV